MARRLECLLVRTNSTAIPGRTSYVNHYATVGLEAELTERLSIESGLHFERNNWTSGIEGDERKGGHKPSGRAR